MSVQSSSTVSFPNQQAIIDYINAHPLKGSLDTPIVISIAPNGIEKISKFFANKTMSLDEIPTKVKDVLIDNVEQPKIEKLYSAIKSLKNLIGESPSVEFATREKMKENVVLFYDLLLKDLLDGSYYTPPKKGEESWERHVTDLKPQGNS